MPTCAVSVLADVRVAAILSDSLLSAMKNSGMSVKKQVIRNSGRARSGLRKCDNPKFERASHVSQNRGNLDETTQSFLSLV